MPAGPSPLNSQPFRRQPFHPPRPPAPAQPPLRPASLQPGPLDRFGELLRPGWFRTPTARRVAAGLLVVVAVLLMFRGDPGAARTSVVVAARDLSPGQTLTRDDVTVAERESSAVVAGTLTDVAAAVGHTVAGPVPTGEALVDTRVLGPRLASAAVGLDDARLVPIRLADAGVGELLREGDVVDVLTVAAEPVGDAAGPPGAHVLATGAVVVLARRDASSGTGRDHVVLVALGADQATAVAAASLVSALTVTVH